jgi:dihydroneopterin aldolase
MNTPSALLETVAQDLAHGIHAMDGRTRSVSVRIIKKHPPLHAFEGSVGVTYKKDF